MKFQVSQFAIDSIKIKLSQKIGFTIYNKSDCAKLSELIEKKGGGRVSESTLYRLFFQSEKHKPYKNTLDIICDFLGYKTSIEFFNTLNDEYDLLGMSGITSSRNSHQSLIYHCIQRESFEPLFDFFDGIEIESEEFKTGICLSIFDSLLKTNKDVQFFEAFSNQPFVREYIFEKAHDPKFRIKNYETGYRYYLNENKLKSIKGIQDYMFGNAVLFRYYFLTERYDSALECGKKLYQQLSIGVEYEKQIHHFPVIRFLSYKIWYLQLMKKEKSEIVEYAQYLIDFCLTQKSRLNYTDQKILFHTVAETFFFSELDEGFQFQLESVFSELIANAPVSLQNKKPKQLLHYFEPNGLLYHRP